MCVCVCVWRVRKDDEHALRTRLIDGVKEMSFATPFLIWLCQPGEVTCGLRTPTLMSVITFQMKNEYA